MRQSLSWEDDSRSAGQKDITVFTRTHHLTLS